MVRNFLYADREKNVDRIRFRSVYISDHSGLDCVVEIGCLCGAVAQLGERLNGIQEVVSSILISSTT